MTSSHKQKRNDGSHQCNDIVISDDIETTESYAGVGDNNVINNKIYNNYDLNSSNHTNSSLSKRKSKPLKHLEIKMDDKIKSTNHSTHNNKTDSKLTSNADTKIKSACKSGRKKKNSFSLTDTDSNASQKLPSLLSKCGIIEQDQLSEINSSINNQIERIGNRKLQLSVSERKNQMKKILDRGRQNWSKFKSEIDFIKQVESNQSNQATETENMIKNEKLLNVFVNDIAMNEKEYNGDNTVNNVDISEYGNKLNDENEPIRIEDQDSDCDNYEFQTVINLMEKVYPNSSLSDDMAMSLKQMLFHSTSRSWGSEWYKQNIEFHSLDSEIPFGLIQKNNNSNSILTILQAEFLIEALFCGDLNRNWIQNLKRNRNRQLSNTLSRIICRCKTPESNIFQLCLLDKNLKGRSIGVVKPDGITECLVIFEIMKKEELQKFILRNISQFIGLHSPGLILLIISCLMTYGITNCQMKLSDKTRLIDPFGFANEELMNFLIHGSFNSHYFNEKIEIICPETEKSTFIYGIPERTSVGFLTTEKHCEYCLEIGTYLKTPKYPVWIVKWKNNTYFVLFCHNRTLISDWKAEIRFKLYLYSPTSKNHSLLSMIIDSSQSELENMKLSKQEKERKIELEKQAQNIMAIRLKGLSETSRKFLLDDCSIEEYIGDAGQLSVDDGNLTELDEIIHIKWPNAIVSLDDDGLRVLTNLLKH